MTETEWHTRIDWLIVWDDDTRVLALKTELAGRVEPDNPGQALAALRKQTGIDAAVLRLSGAETDETARIIRCTLVAAPRTGGNVLPQRPLSGAGRGDRHAEPATWVSAVEAGLDGGPPWTDPRWIDGVAEWLSADLGLDLDDRLEQERLWDLSAVLRAATPRGDVYVKSSVATPLFADEGAVTAVLDKLFPAQVPAVLGHHGDRRLLALADFGPAIRHASDEVNAEMLSSYAALQVESVERVPELRSAGCLDRRLPWLSGQITWLGEVDHAAPPTWCDPATWVTAEEAAQLRESMPGLMAACAELTGFAVPYSLVHGDLHLGNVARGPLGYLFFDWTDAAIAHPFLDLSSQFFQPGGSALDGYLARWADFDSPERLRAAWKLAAPLCALNQAISYASLAAHLPPPVEKMVGGGTAMWLRRLLRAQAPGWVG
ncbi:phosphotransferase [Nonomuraea sp. 10N515B]|uniref:phosphotransferase n=1 Tax=Nonomuraea sp. 10N515B TaxID=3457422 RepID=UPI003FCD8B40